MSDAGVDSWVLACGLDFLVGESPADRICRFIRSFNGVSLNNQPERLAQLTARGVDRGSIQASKWFTNCGTSALGFLAAACGTVACAREVHPQLGAESVNGTSIGWLYQIAGDCGVAINYKLNSYIPKGSLVSYAHGQHVEWVLEDSDVIIDHGGGGRARNAITVGRGDIRSSLGRPLTEVFNFSAILPASPEPATGELERVLTPGVNAEAG